MSDHDKTLFLLPGERLSAMLASLMEGYPVYGPAAKSKQSMIPKDAPFWVYKRLAAPEELALHWDVTIMPPKKLFYPAEEPVLTYEFEGWGEPVIHDEPFIVFGVHPYDLCAIGQLDRVFHLRPYADRYRGGECRRLRRPGGEQEGRGPADALRRQA
jgi:sulfhydrogenase subunit beta (sulfur reductase)